MTRKGYFGEFGGSFIPEILVATFEELIDAYEEALHIFTRLGHRQGQAAELSNIGNIRFNLNQLDRARTAFQDALYIFGLIDHPRGQADCLGNIGLVHRDQGRIPEAMDNLHKARAIYEPLHIKELDFERPHLRGFAGFSLLF